MNALRRHLAPRPTCRPLRLTAQGQHHLFTSNVSSVDHKSLTLLSESLAASKGCLGEIVRYGLGDACVTLNVGGTEFITLRSTVNTNAVLAEMVARAEVNPGMTKSSVVFIDRSPQHFAYIMSHLRNRAELATAQHFEKSKQKVSTIYVNLPEDPNLLSELYVEAVYYRIPELQNALKKYSMAAHVSSFFKKQTNLDFLMKLWLQLRTGALAAGTVGGTWFVTMQHDWETTLRKWGWR